MDIERTRNYYQNLKEEDLCDCAYCKNFRSKIKKSYPLLSDFLDSLGVDIEKPFETNPWEVEDYKLTYDPVQYVFMGSSENFEERKIGDIFIETSDSYPETNIGEEHFVIGLGPICIN